MRLRLREEELNIVREFLFRCTYKMSTFSKIHEDDETEADPGSAGLLTSVLSPGREGKERARAIITGGTMTLLLLAASLVTTSFLMSPLLQQFLGAADSFIVQFFLYLSF